MLVESNIKYSGRQECDNGHMPYSEEQYDTTMQASDTGPLLNGKVHCSAVCFDQTGVDDKDAMVWFSWQVVCE